MRIDEALRGAVERLRGVSDSPRLDAELLLARAIDVAGSYLLAHPEDVLDDDAVERFRLAIDRRAAGVPVPYITGVREFWSIALAVSPDTLVPRPETELLVELALGHLPPGRALRVLDLGTGSGAIAVALAKERPSSFITATDQSAAALAVARENARRHLLANIEFTLGDWTSAVAGARFDLIVSNPPYLAVDDPALPSLRHEPLTALVAGNDGLDTFRILARDCRALLDVGGSLLLEHGVDQREQVAGILVAAGWSQIECFRDLAGRPRVTQATWLAGDATA
ncbi:MAG: peptide chain release factor N(5)-glutamine methyltransferase [Woeseia sp.]